MHNYFFNYVSIDWIFTLHFNVHFLGFVDIRLCHSRPLEHSFFSRTDVVSHLFRLSSITSNVVSLGLRTRYKPWWFAPNCDSNTFPKRDRPHQDADYKRSKNRYTGLDDSHMPKLGCTFAINTLRSHYLESQFLLKRPLVTKSLVRFCAFLQFEFFMIASFSF